MEKKIKDKTPFIEKFGVKYLQNMQTKHPPERVDLQAYILDENERKQINKIERNAIIRAALAGGISTIIAAFIAFYYDYLQDDNASFFSNSNLTFFLIVTISSVIISLIEIYYLYWDTLYTVHNLARAAHLDINKYNQQNNILATSLARAALELPNELDSDLKINPTRESSKFFLFFATIIYKLKVSISNFLFKAFIQRTLGRAISRAWLNFVAVPVCAFWDGYVCWLILREVKVRVFGPSAANEIIQKIISYQEYLTDNGRIALLRAVGSCIVRTEDLHPNLEYLYRAFDEIIKEPEGVILDDTKLFLESLKILNENEKEIVLQTLVFSSIIDGKITLKERNLLEDAFRICEKPFQYVRLKQFVKRYRAGLLLNIDLDNFK